MKTWVLFFLGTLFYFWQRYCRRDKKTIGFSIKFWLKDNAPEFVTTIILDVAAMLILLDQNTIIDFSKWLPEGWALSGNLVIAFGIGAGLAKVWYELFKKKVTK